MSNPVLRPAIAAGLALLAAAPASAQLRVAVWNISNYAGGRDAAIRTVVYGQFEGRSMAPDVLVGEEFTSQAAVNAMRTILNTAPGSPGDWASAPFIDGADTDSAFFYRTSKVQYLTTTICAVGSSSTTNQPRNTYRFDIRPTGYSTTPATLALYGTHMKAGSAAEDQSRRLVEATRVRDNAQGTNTNGPGTALPAGYNFLICGDFNIQTSSQAAYQELVGNQANNAGRFFDPISTPGSWNNNGSFRFVHTQDPSGAGGMDDRHDQILLSASLIDGAGLDYIGNPAIPYSTTTWNDLNHSYRSWGNDGTSLDTTLRTTGNTMVGPVIAQGIIDCAVNGGHLPVFLDLRVPAKITSDTVIDFGVVPVGSPADAALSAGNGGDTALWTAAGIASVTYTLSPSAGFSAPGGSFIDAPGGALNSHTISMDTSTFGAKSGTITILSNDPDQPVRVVTLMGEVVTIPPLCPADFNGDGFLDFFDTDAFVTCFEGAECPPGKDADFNGDGFVDFFDSDAFFQAFEFGC